MTLERQSGNPDVAPRKGAAAQGPPSPVAKGQAIESRGNTDASLRVDRSVFATSVVSGGSVREVQDRVDLVAAPDAPGPGVVDDLDSAGKRLTVRIGDRHPCLLKLLQPPGVDLGVELRRGITATGVEPDPGRASQRVGVVGSKLDAKFFVQPYTGGFDPIVGI